MRRSAAARLSPIGFPRSRCVGSLKPIAPGAPAAHELPGIAHGTGARTRLSRHMRRDRKPFSVPTRPDISIAAVPLPAVRGGVAGACMDDRSISQKAHFDFLRSEAADHHRSRRLCKELVLVDE